jgi:hypothetical protein
MSSKIYKIPCTWAVNGTIEVAADSLSEAIATAETFWQSEGGTSNWRFCPDDADYTADTFDVSAADAVALNDPEGVANLQASASLVADLTIVS